MYPGSTSRSIPSQTALITGIHDPEPVSVSPDVEISDLSTSTRLTCVRGTVRATVDKSFLDSFVDTYYDQIGIELVIHACKITFNKAVIRDAIPGVWSQLRAATLALLFDMDFETRENKVSPRLEITLNLIGR